MKEFTKIARLVATFGQLGFTLITPPVVMALLGWRLQSRFAWGTWVMVLCLAVGLLTAAASAVQFARRILAGEKKARQDKEKPVVFYTHE